MFCFVLVFGVELMLFDMVVFDGYVVVFMLVLEWLDVVMLVCDVEGQDFIQVLVCILVCLFGVYVVNCGNDVQDLQFFSCGYGVCVSFGVCGLCLVVDGILVIMFDGQGQFGYWFIVDVVLLEVLCGLFLVLYGSISGGVIVLQSCWLMQDCSQVSVVFGSFGLCQVSIGLDCLFVVGQMLSVVVQFI